VHGRDFLNHEVLVREGLRHARAQGKRLGRQPIVIEGAAFEAVSDRSLRDAAMVLGVSRSVVQRLRASWLRTIPRRQLGLFMDDEELAV
jgi:hypothetical protein